MLYSSKIRLYAPPAKKRIIAAIALFRWGDLSAIGADERVSKANRPGLSKGGSHKFHFEHYEE